MHLTASNYLMGVKAIAARMGISPKAAEHRIARGQIPTFMIGGTRCAHRDVLEALHLTSGGDRGSLGEFGGSETE